MQIDQKKVTVLVLLDLSKAFDSLNHQILLRKLVNVGVSQTALKLFESYLSGRNLACEPAHIFGQGRENK